MAVVQMEQLGAAFLTNGDHAEKVKSLLQRCSDVRFSQLALTIGWRKNDSASLMAGSAGGQAIALLSMCLMNLFKHSDAGMIIAGLSSRILSDSKNVSSASQLADVAKLLTGKLDVLGFGNLLAREVTKIHRVYAALGRDTPRDLLEPIDTESAVDLLHQVSRALCEDHKVCRFSGSRGIGHILGLMLMMFPRSTAVSVENTIIQDVDCPKIYCEITYDPHSELNLVHLETSIASLSPQIDLPIVVETTSKSVRGRMPYRYKWSGWLADHLELHFLNFGLECTQGILDACCNFLLHLPTIYKIRPTVTNTPKARECLKTFPLLSLLGPLPRARMYKTCEGVLRTAPTIAQTSFQEAFADLVRAVSNATRGVECCCQDEYKCNWNSGWKFSNSKEDAKKKDCVLDSIWRVIGSTLGAGLWSFFIDVGSNAVIWPLAFLSNLSLSMPSPCENDYYTHYTAEDLINRVFNIGNLDASNAEGVLARSSDSCTIYPTILQSLSIPSQQSVAFAFVEGRITYQRRYHRCLKAKPVRGRPKATTSLRITELKPSHIGVHEGKPLVTIREGFDCLEILCSLRFSGNLVKVDLRKAVLGYLGMRWTDSCPHPATKNMDPHKYRPLPTSVASPSARGRIAVAMTRANSMAQFFCCEDGHQAVFQKHCCLDCAAESVQGSSNVTIIVS
ncbi:hypothetical protein MMC20_006535 [Loxospora ochrophaea]|nr:hypothetical protein [Loxospora ochrophaea]